MEDLQRIMTADLIDIRVPVTLLREGRELQIVVEPGELDTAVGRTR